MTRTGAPLRSGPERGQFPRLCGARFTTGTAAAASRAAGSPLARGITSVTGRRAAQPRSRISPCSVAGTIARSMRRAIRSIGSQTACSNSGGRMAGSYPRSRRRLRCLPIRSKPSRHGTTRRGCVFTRGRRARPGSGSLWMWAGRSTSCIPWPRTRPALGVSSSRGCPRRDRRCEPSHRPEALVVRQRPAPRQLEQAALIR